MRDAASLETATKGCRAVYHCAAQLSTTSGGEQAERVHPPLVMLRKVLDDFNFARNEPAPGDVFGVARRLPPE